VLSGKLDFLKMVKGEEDSTYSKLNKRFQKLREANSADKIKIREVLKLWEIDGIESAMDYYYGKSLKINDFDDVIQIPNIDTLLKDDEIINKIIESLKNDGLL
jgi:hypothetical protein